MFAWLWWFFNIPARARTSIVTTGPEVKTASTKKDQTRIPTDNHSSPRPSETEINFQLIQHRQTQSKDFSSILLLPCKEPDSLNECIWFRLKNSAQCRATQQIFYKLFTFKIIPNLQLKVCTLYVVTDSFGRKIK
jgi:hypothetical protein